MLKKISLLVSLLFVLPFTAFAGIDEGTFTINPFVGWYVFEGNEALKGNVTGGLNLGYNLSPNFGMELTGKYGKFDTQDGKTSQRAVMYGVNAIYNFMPDQSIVPFFSAGVGYLDIDNTNIKNTGTFNYGFGFNFFFTDTISLRTDVRHVIQFEDHHNNLDFTMGLNFLLGKKEKVKQEVKPEPVKPAPVAEIKPEPVAEVKQPEPVKVEPIDSDGDGVPDDKDKCPGTPKGAKVNDVGCWVLKNVQFDYNKSKLKPSFFKQIDEVVVVLKNNPDLKVEVQGHTDNKGRKAYNLKLSQLRAKEVKNYLIKKGINKNRLHDAGYGLLKPVASNKTEEGKAQNRRVQFEPIIK